MKEKIRKIIREEVDNILESHGVDYSANSIAKFFTREVTNKIREKSGGYKNKISSMDSSVFVSKNFTKKTRKKYGINFVNIDIFVIDKKRVVENNKVFGKFEQSKTKQHLIDNYFVYDLYFDLKIYNWDYNTNLYGEIFKVLAHEFLHAFREMHTFNQNNYSKALYNARNNSRGLNISDNIKELDEFLEIFYLSLPEEVTARVHEAHSQMSEYKMGFKNKTSDEVIKELNKLSVFRDFMKIQEFNINTILGLPETTKVNFVNKFNQQLENSKKLFDANSIKIISEPNSFFNYWIDRAKKESLKARHKIVSQAISLFGGKTMISEYNNKIYGDYSEQFYSEIMENLNSDSLLTVYGFIRNSYPIEECFLFLEEIRKLMK